MVHHQGKPANSKDFALQHLSESLQMAAMLPGILALWRNVHTPQVVSRGNMGETIPQLPLAPHKMKTAILALAAASLASAHADQYWNTLLVNGTLANTAAATVAAGGSSVRDLSGCKYATITTIPESIAAGLGGLGMLALLRRRRGMTVFRGLGANSGRAGSLASCQRPRLVDFRDFPFAYRPHS